MTTSSDGNVWFGENRAYIGKIAPDGSVTEHAIPSGNNPIDLGAGKQGSVWFTTYFNAGAPTVGKVTSSGVVTEYTLNPASCAPATGLALGPDGNMWFVYCDAATGNLAVGKITTAGVQTYFPVPGSWGTDIYGPSDLAAGPDGKLWFAASDRTNAKVAVANITTGGAMSAPFFGPPNTSDNSYSLTFGADGKLYLNGPLGFLQMTTSGVFTQLSQPTGLELQGDVILGPDKQLWFADYYNPHTDNSGLLEFNTRTKTFGPEAELPQRTVLPTGLTIGADGDVWVADGNQIVVYEEKTYTVGIRLNGELSFTDPNYGFEIGYAVGTGTQTQTISLPAGESVQFKNLDTEPHSAAFLGNATSNSAPWPGSFNGSTTKSRAGTAIGTTGWATGSLLPSKSSPIYETGMPGFYMIGCQYHYSSDEMRTVIIVH